jgi:hypothetical protein
VTCIANSLVGTIIRAWIGPFGLILFIRGRENAAVFPVPVCACPITSLPFKISGIQYSWIGKGLSIPISLTALTRDVFRPNSSNDTIFNSYLVFDKSYGRSGKVTYCFT